MLARIEPLLEEHPDGWLLAAAAAEALGAIDDSRVLLARARSLSGQGYLAPHRCARHAKLHIALAAYAGRPARHRRCTPALPETDHDP